MIASIVAWWAAVAVSAPWVLRGLPLGSPASWWSLPMGLAGLVEQRDVALR
ncbi:MAG TPA: hypothetical protein VG184_10150 [Acidimicrobiales bacterium]|nr:hypothetical protein [Acidimicrobiales bacterium]